VSEKSVFGRFLSTELTLPDLEPLNSVVVLFIFQWFLCYWAASPHPVNKCSPFVQTLYVRVHCWAVKICKTNHDPVSGGGTDLRASREHCMWCGRVQIPTGRGTCFMLCNVSFRDNSRGVRCSSDAAFLPDYYGHWLYWCAGTTVEMGRQFTRIVRVMWPTYANRSRGIRPMATPTYDRVTLTVTTHVLCAWMKPVSPWKLTADMSFVVRSVGVLLLYFVWCAWLHRDPTHSADGFVQQVAWLVLWFGLDDWMTGQINSEATRMLVPSPHWQNVKVDWIYSTKPITTQSYGWYQQRLQHSRTK